MSWTWRAESAPIIARVLAATAGQPAKEVRAALRAAYPFGVRRYHPYRIWCDEVRAQTGKKQIADVVRRSPVRPALPRDERQQALFSEAEQ